MNASYSRQEIIAEDEVLLGCRENEIVERLPARLSHGILEWAQKTPTATAIVSAGRRLDYATLAEQVSAMQALLLARGVRPGDRVMLVSENSAVLMTLVLALSEMDGVAVVINARLAPREIDMIAADCEPRVIIYTTEDSADAARHAEQADATTIETPVGRMAVSEPRDATPEQTGQAPEDQVLAMIYTTGTTGTPKGVMLTHRNLTFIAYVSGRLRGIRAGDPVYCVLPMSHVFGLSAVSSSVLFSGGTVHLVARFDPAEVLRALAEEAIVGFLGVPTMYTRMLETLAGMEGWRAPSLRFMFSGGAPLDPGLKERVQAAFGMPLHNGYGLTESGPTICQTRLYAPLASCAVGYVLPGVQARLVGQDGKDVAPGEVGELWAKGPNIMKGYFRKPELTAQVLQAGWLNTGDLAYLDSDGALNISGRTKELIIRSGFNVYPPEVEAVLTHHLDVSVAAVVGRQIEGNEEVIAFVQAAPGATLDTEALLAFARERLAGYKIPAQVIVMDELPAAPSGKILKHQLKV